MKFFSLLIGIFCIVALSVVHVLTEEIIDVQAEFEFKLIGKYNYLPYDQFRGLPPDICTNLTILHLAYLEFDPNTLVQSLEGCNKLNFINLTEVGFLNPVTRKVTLPNLETFGLKMYAIEANTEKELMDHLFFFKYESEEIIKETVTRIYLTSSGRRDDMWLDYYYNDQYEQQLVVNNMKYDITKYFYYQVLYFQHSFVDHQSIKVNNLTTLTLFSADYEDRLFETLKSAHSLTKLVIQKLRVNIPRRSIDLSIFPSIENFTRLQIENAEIWSSKSIHLRELTRLYLFNCEFNTTLISVSSSLNYLMFQQVRLTGVDLNTFLSRMNNLKHITLDYIRIPGEHQIDLTTLRNSSDTLEHMWFYGMQVQISSRHLKFFKMEYLGFVECSIDIDENAVPFSLFSSTFPKIYHVGLLHNNNLSYSMFQEILNSSVTYVDLLPRKFEVPEITKFLKDSGVSSGVVGSRLGKSKNSTTGWWIEYLGHKNTIPNTTLTNTILYAYILLLMVVCGFGLFGSLVSSIVLTRKNMWGSTSCILLGLTFCDSLVLLTYICSVLYFGIKLILDFLEFGVSKDKSYRVLGFQVTEFSVKSLDDLQYTILYPLNKTAYTGSVYATVLLTIERYVAVCWPLHARRWLRTRVAVTSILIVLSCSIILNFPRWIEAQQYKSYIQFDSLNFGWYLDEKRLIFDRQTDAYGLLRNRYYREYYHGWIWVTVMYVIPISGLTILNFLILKQLRKSNQNRKALAATNPRNNAVNQEQVQLNSLTRMLLSVIMIFILCNSVSGCIVWFFTEYHGWDPMDVEIFSCIPLIINSSTNFIIYVLLGSKFRAELWNIISKWKNVICSCWHWPRRRSDTGNNARPIPLVQLPSPQQEHFMRDCN